MCGKPVARRDLKVIYVESVRLSICPSCYSRLVKGDVVREIKEEAARTRSQKASARPVKKSEERVLEEYEVVSNYAERVKQARERLGLTQKALADMVRESENTIKRIESGRLVPTIALARKLEEVLSIKLLEPVVDTAEARLPSPAKMKELTLGDVVSLKKREK
ncbi:MAG: multiprotein bridging factor aMBF1 [Sulfolobales archaeon]|nr:multiprotein bridging factor aMBF1 [Sulfolobales archaeon]